MQSNRPLRILLLIPSRDTSHRKTNKKTSTGQSLNSWIYNKLLSLQGLRIDHVTFTILDEVEPQNNKKKYSNNFQKGTNADKAYIVMKQVSFDVMQKQKKQIKKFGKVIQILLSLFKAKANSFKMLKNFFGYFFPF